LLIQTFFEIIDAHGELELAFILKTIKLNFFAILFAIFILNAAHGKLV